jgi:oxygen-independent coproporphyrinogen-3 oxidase
MPMSGKEPVSLYWHIPFCSRKCGYCHFYVLPDKEELKDELLEGFALEWSRFEPFLDGREVVSVYFGGGTPALFGPKRLQKVLSWIPRTSSCEITLEANPVDATLDLLKAYADLGINRLSIGVQSLDDTLLQILTREHNAKGAIEAIHNASKAGFNNVTIDLMYDVPNQTLAAWRSTLSMIGKLPIHHLSLYNLTIEPHTQFFKRQGELKPLVPNEETSLAMYQEAVAYLESVHLKQYEVSAFAQSGFESQHNSGYWTGRSFHGFGPSAFSYWGKRRFRNIANQRRYLEALRAGQSPVDFEEKLDEEAHKRELFVIQMRLVKGVHLPTFTALYGSLNRETHSMLSTMIENRLIIDEGGWLKLTDRGRICYDAIATELI